MRNYRSEYRLVRKFSYPDHLTLGDLRAIVAECDRRGLDASALVSVDERAAWVSGLNPDGSVALPYPQGNGGHYVTGVVVDGKVLRQEIVEVPEPSDRDIREAHLERLDRLPRAEH